MLSGIGVAAPRVFISAVPNPPQDQHSSPPGTNHPHTENIASGAAAEERIQPAPESEKPNDNSGTRKADGESLSEEEERQVRDLKKTDTQVRAHEAAHAAAGGPYAGSPSFEFTTGPDGKRYATSGEVEIDSAPVRGNPEATIRKMDIVIRAALSPAEPSSQDLAVARSAQAERSKAQSELFKQRVAERNGDDGEAPGKDKTQGPGGQTDPLAGRIAEAAAAYARSAGSGAAARAGLFAATPELSIIA